MPKQIRYSIPKFKLKLKEKIKISAVSYLNTLPFIYGIENSSGLSEKIELSKDIPSICADKLISGEADLGLIPVAEISKLQNPYIISDYCIGSVGKVDSVLLLSNIHVSKIKKILLDYQSRTSVNLIKILAKEYFNINPEFENTRAGYEDNEEKETAVLIIGDRAFNYRKKFNFVYDLSEIWLKHTSYPFVFATWVSRQKISDDFITEFNKALKYGLKNIDSVIDKYKKQINTDCIDIKKYLTENISYTLDTEKRKGMQLFLKKIKKLKN